MLKIFIFIFLLPVGIINSQNFIYNPSMEVVKTNYIHFNAHSKLEDYTDNWKRLYKHPGYHNDTVKSAYGLYEDSLPKAFKGYGYIWLEEGGQTNDTLGDTSLSLVYSTTYDLYRYPNWACNSGFCQKIKTPLQKDSTYLLSYRLKSGSELKNENSYNLDGGRNYKNIVNNFGVVFSTKDMSNIIKYKIPYREELQDTILDTTYKWRLIEREFKADSAYEYINFAQFRDLRTIKYKVVKPTKIYDDLTRERLNYNKIWFALLVDEVRLLPKWQYLKTTAEVYTCGKDSVEMEVLSGTGGYIWIEQSNPSQILSTSSKLKVKANDTNNMFVVMSPFDTAYIPVYAMKQTFVNDTFNYTICNKTPLKISNSNIYIWNDAKMDTLRFLDKAGFYWYETKGLCQTNRTYINLSEGITYNDTFKAQTCNTYKFGDSIYSKSGTYTHKFTAKNGCDSLSTLILDSKEINAKIKLENGIFYTALTPNASYQWYYCYPWRRITNAQYQTFSTITKGSYAVVVSHLGCTDTSDCIALYSSGLQLLQDNEIIVFPNPTKDIITIKIGNYFKENHIEIYNTIGQKIKSITTKTAKIQVDLKNEAKGVYLIKVNEIQIFKVFKE